MNEEKLAAAAVHDPKPDYSEEIKKIIGGVSSPQSVKEKLADYHENDIAEAMSEMTAADRIKLYRILDVSVLSDIFEYISEERAAEYLTEMDIKKAVHIISGMETDSAADILREVPKDKRLIFIDLLDDEIKSRIELIASFDEDEIGSRTTVNYIAVPQDITVGQAMRELVRQAEKNDNISTVFVVGENNVFYGAADLKDIITGCQTAPLSTIIHTSFPYVYASEEIEDCLDLLKKYSESIIPVLDNENRILGVITLQSVIEAVDDEMGEDYAKLAGLSEEQDYSEPVMTSVKKRMPWLLVLLGLGLIVSSVVGSFEKVISRLTIIMTFQSMILDMSGNVGTQSLAVTIRVLTNDNLTFKEKMHLVSKEMKTGLCCGLILAVIAIIFVGIYIMFAKGRPPMYAFAISTCIGASLVLSMLISSAVGTLVPMFFKKIGVDPAVASGPLITTVNDLIAVVTYYGLSLIFLINILKLA